MTRTLAVELLTPYRTTELNAEVFDLAGVSQSTYIDSAFSAVDSNGVRVLTYEVASTTFQGSVVIKTADGATRIGTFDIEGATANDCYIELTDSDHGLTAIKNAIGSSGGSSIGPGSSANVCRALSNGQPIPDADAWLTTDAAGTQVYAGTLRTNSEGKVTFMCDSGVTYYFWFQKDGLNAIQGQAFVAD